MLRSGTVTTTGGTDLTDPFVSQSKAEELYGLDNVEYLGNVGLSPFFNTAQADADHN